MGCGQRCRFVAPSWCMPPLEMSHECRAPRLVQRHPERDAIPQRAVDRSGVFRKCLCGIPPCPAPLILQRLRQIPVIQCQHWGDPSPQNEGGWTRRDTAQAFAEYAAAVYRALGDRVPFWMTLNEPW